MRTRAARCTALASVALLGVACAGRSLAKRSATRSISSSVATTTSTTSTAPAGTSTTTEPEPSGSPVQLAANGVASARFDQTESSAINALDQALGNPVQGPVNMDGNCDIDAAEQWATLTAYFHQGIFVGYGTWAVGGEAVPRGNFQTAVGLRVGDTITRAKQLYGAEFQTSFAQGGSWSISTQGGQLFGYLGAPPNEAGSPVPTILAMGAGSVGCPAATP